MRLAPSGPHERAGYVPALVVVSLERSRPFHPEWSRQQHLGLEKSTSFWRWSRRPFLIVVTGQKE
jgi:hypothetical protein